MPYYLETDDRDLLKKLNHINVCAECGSGLEPLYDLNRHLPYLQCRVAPWHEGIAREYRDPKELNILSRREDMEKEHGTGTTTALERSRVPMTGALTQTQAMTILRLVYPRVPEDQITRTAIFCRDFSLHPLAKEVYLIPFGTGEKKQWVMVVGIAANRKMAHALKGNFSFIDDSPRAASQEEVIKQFGARSDEADENVISICKLQGETGNLAIGFGLWPNDNKPQGMDKGNTKRNMANIRAERQAMDRLPGRAMPRGIEVIDEAYTEVPDVGKVVTKTGEIVEAQYEEVKPEPKEVEAPAPKKHWCEEHNCEYEKKRGRGSTSWYSHLVEGGEWCNEIKKKAPAQASASATEEAQTKLPENNEPVDETDSKVEDLFQWIADKMKWKNTEPVRTWLVNACKIPEAEIDADPQAVYHKVKELHNWED